MKNKGFTLIELSIVLIIIALLVGGVFLGQSMIRQSQISAAIADEQRYVQAVQSFQQKFGALPGDITNATTYWGVGTTCPATNASPLSGTLTCNGDGNGQIGRQGTSSANYPEMFLFWNHLSISQMIPGFYNGAPSSAGATGYTSGVNCPKSRIDGADFTTYWVGVRNGDADYYDAFYGHIFYLNAHTPSTVSASPALTAIEAMNIDTKYDDGLPVSGNIFSWKSTGTINSTCTTSGTSSATYNTANAGLVCSLGFITGF